MSQQNNITMTSNGHIPKSPFAKSTSTPGTGSIVLSLLPPGKQMLTTCTYQYPLKLIAPDNTRLFPSSSSFHSPSSVPEHDEETSVREVTVVFLLTYGGGLVAGDQIDLTISMAENTRLALLTQGSTKIFKSDGQQGQRLTVTRQTLNVKIGKGAALCYLPDPTQPFAESVYEQRQTFYVDRSSDNEERGQGGESGSSLLVLDWVSEGRRARGESWSLWSWKGRNEIREFDPKSKGRLLLRDAVMLQHEEEDQAFGTGLVHKTNNMGIFGTLIVYGSIYKSLAKFILDEFADHPRIGAKTWGTEEKKSAEAAAAQNRVDARLASQAADDLLWTAAQVRGCVLVKFGARELDGARRWLGDLLKREGTVEREFGHQALLCLR